MKFLSVLVLIHLLSHVPYMHLPAVGNHVWRQCNTLAVAKNYYEEDMNLLRPRVDKRYNTPGITGPQFPAYDWTLAVLYKTFGFSESLHRWFSWVLMVIAILGMYRLSLDYSGSRFSAAIASIFIAFVPELYFHAINALPDILSLAAMLWGWYLGRIWLRSQRWVPCLAAALLLALAGMVKMQFLVAGAAIGVEFLLLRARSGKFSIQAFILAIIAILPTAWWYWYAAKLVKLYGLHEFVHAMRHARSLSEGVQIFLKTVFSDFPEIFSGYAMIGLVIAGVWFGRRSFLKYPGLSAYGVCSMLFYFLVQYQFIHHGYYAIIFLPVFALLAARGAESLKDSKAGMLILLIWLAPVWAWARMAQSNWTERNYKIPASFVNADSRRKFHTLNDTTKRWIVGPDVSGCVYFYYLHAKGYPWTDTAETGDMFVKYAKQGADGVITNDTQKLMGKTRGRLILEKTGSVDGFYWYRIKK